MIALFKESAAQFMEQSEGTLVPFYVFYHAILIATKYSKLIYMETAPNLSDIDSIFKKTNQISLVGTTEGISNRLALDDMLRAIAQNTACHIKTSLKTLHDKFTAAPYGFVELDVQWLLATLFKQGKVSFTVNSKLSQ